MNDVGKCGFQVLEEMLRRNLWRKALSQNQTIWYEFGQKKLTGLRVRRNGRA